ncbi:Transposon Ty3-G Gag-Pol polyprotein [Abeliophyllum distichum]|uniref:Transposon Ty3-G Gag-Pol polyprotein n=1 Tax=Abeliophyllum distichum TaxID=126358 RepID=A0ABD1ULS5_9LAMI
MVVEDERVEDPLEEEVKLEKDVENGEEEEVIQISVNALVGNMRHRTIRISSKIKVMLVFVANGHKLESKALCKPLIWQMQDLEFQFRPRSMKLEGSDMVLGVDWLSQFGPLLLTLIRVLSVSRMEMKQWN